MNEANYKHMEHQRRKDVILKHLSKPSPSKKKPQSLAGIKAKKPQLLCRCGRNKVWTKKCRCWICHWEEDRLIQASRRRLFDTWDSAMGKVLGYSDSFYNNDLEDLRIYPGISSGFDLMEDDIDAGS